MVIQAAYEQRRGLADVNIFQYCGNIISRYLPILRNFDDSCSNVKLTYLFSNVWIGLDCISVLTHTDIQRAQCAGIYITVELCVIPG